MNFLKQSLLFCIVLTLSFACYNPGPNDPKPSGGLSWINCTKQNEFYTCGSACQTKCETLGERCRILTFRCNDDCFCCDGYARDCEDNCIPVNKCPPKGTCPIK